MRLPPTSRSVRDSSVATLARLPLERALRLVGRWRGVLVLGYHRIGDGAGVAWDRAMWSASAEQFDDQLRALARDTEVIGPAEVEPALRAAPGRRVLLTFDDGYRDNYEVAFPLLRAHGLTATFFLTSGFLDDPRPAWWDEIAWMVRNGDRARLGVAQPGVARPAVARRGVEQERSIAALLQRYKTLPDGEGERLLDRLAGELGCGRCTEGRGEGEGLWLTWEMARELRAAGMAIGGHTVTHPVLARLSRERQHEEIAGCARRLREELGEAMRWFAYPVGARDAFTAETSALLGQCGVEMAFSYYGGFAGPARWDPFDVPRVHVDAALGARVVVQRWRGRR